MSAAAVWFAAAAAGAWPMMWSLVLVVIIYLLIGFYTIKRNISFATWVAADVIGVVLFCQLSIPHLPLEVTLLAALLAATIGFAIDLFVHRSPTVIWGSTIALACLLVITVSIIQPSLVTGSLRLLKDRILPTESTAYAELPRQDIERTLAFTNITNSIDAPFPTGIYNITFRDIDQDGYSDLYLWNTDEKKPITVYLRNNNGQTFVENDLPDTGDLLIEQTAQNSSKDSEILSPVEVSQSAIITDLDSDNDSDIIDIDAHKTLLVLDNDGNGHFSEKSLASIGLEEKQPATYITAADVNNDGLIDLLIINDNEASLYLNSDETLFELHQNFSPSFGISAGFVDFDNDGDNDLYFTGDSQIYVNNGQGDFSDGPSVPIEQLDTPQSTSFADSDNDGDLDFVVSAENGQSQLIRNDFDGGNWIKVQLDPMQQHNRFGAKIAVYQAQETEQNLVGLKNITQDETRIHFGLGPYDNVDVVVSYPDGTDIMRKNIRSGQTVLINDSNDGLDMVGYELTPYVEWSVENSDYTGNPYDIVASVTFTHEETKAVHKTEMFYADQGMWAFRFTATQPGQWSFTTTSQEAALNGLTGQILIYPNANAPGFMTNFGSKWGRTGTNEAFIPQYVMYGGPQDYHNNPAKIEADIQTFIVEHGFTGFNTPVFCRWFDIAQRSCNDIRLTDPNPDQKTFEALEELILHVYQAGGVVHIWAWGDDSRGENPKRWGINQAADRRLQRYIAARLGPLPGWSMGYGYDLWEWVSSEELTDWHNYMYAHFGWPHYLGARSHKNSLDQLSEAMEYSSYEQHRPDYNTYIKTIETRPEKPSFSEDRFRIRDEGRDKDYTMEDTRRGLWQSAMAGGVANIWGNVADAPGANEGLTASAPYPNPEWIKTYATFFDEHFTKDLEPCTNVSESACLESTDNARYILYQEETASITLGFANDVDQWNIIAVDTKKPYQEIPLNSQNLSGSVWVPPYLSDWAVAATKNQ
ncbi:MAG: VCBS repeat-containing protein [Anaerolineae bacterium]|nr:VCBS repeat-containing protein [Anaerolineae bacterium]